MKRFNKSKSEYLREGNDLSASQMRSEDGDRSQGLTEMRDEQINQSDGGGKIPISILLHDGQRGNKRDKASCIPEKKDIHGSEVANVPDANCKCQGTAVAETTHIEVGHPTKDDKKDGGVINIDTRQDAANEYVGETGGNTPAWAQAKPVKGYIKHPVAGYIMHPSFYDIPRAINRKLVPEYLYDAEIDDPLCPAGKPCFHARDCFEVRVRMAVLSYIRHNISYRDAEHIWGVSRSTIQRRKAILEGPSSLVFLLTPTRTSN